MNTPQPLPNSLSDFLQQPTHEIGEQYEDAQREAMLDAQAEYEDQREHERGDDE